MWGDQGVSGRRRPWTRTFGGCVGCSNRTGQPGAPPDRPGPRTRWLPAGRRGRTGSTPPASRCWRPRPAELLTARRADRALRRAEEAVALWRGRPYGTAADQQWARAAVARLQEIRGRLHETHIGALLGTGAVDRALVHLELALGEEPLRERLWAYRITAYRDSGRRSEALATYANARTVLNDELGIEPGPELRALHAALLRDDPSGTSRSRPGLPGARIGATRTPPAPRGRLVGRDALSPSYSTCSAPARWSRWPAPRVAGRPGWRSRPPDGPRRIPRRRLLRGPDLGVTRPRPRYRVLDSRAADHGSGRPGRRPAAVRGVAPDAGGARQLRTCARRRRRAGRRALRRGPGAPVLATSREPLEVDGEHVLRLAPLPVAAAVELFLERLDGPAPEVTVRGRDRCRRRRPSAGSRARRGPGPRLHPGRDRRAGPGRRQHAEQGRPGPGGAAATTAPSARRSTPATATSPRRLRCCTVPSGPSPARSPPSLAAGLVGADATDAVAGLAHRSLLAPLGAARPGGASRFAQLATVRGHAHHEAERAGEDPAPARNAWIERLVRARPALGSTRHVGWYRALDDDLAALRATLQHTLVDAPSSSGVALAARLGRLLGLQRHGRGGRALAADRRRWVCRRSRPGRPADRAAVQVDLGARARAGPGRRGPRPGPRRHRRGGRRDRRRRRAGVRVPAVAAGAVARAGDGALLAELAAATRRIAAGSAALDVLVRHVELVHATIAEPGPELVARYLALHRDARAEDNLYTAWLTAANAARLMLAAGRAAEAVAWARTAVRASAEAGLRHNPYALEVYGAALGRAGEHAAALRVFGAVEEQHRGAGVVWPGTERRRSHRPDDGAGRRSRGRAGPLGGCPGHAGGARRGLSARPAAGSFNGAGPG